MTRASAVVAAPVKNRKRCAFIPDSLHLANKPPVMEARNIAVTPVLSSVDVIRLKQARIIYVTVKIMFPKKYT